MKAIIYSLGIIGGLLLIFRIIGFVSPFFSVNAFFYVGSALILFIFIPLVIKERIKQQKKIDEIINSYKGKNKPQILSAGEKIKQKGGI